LIVTPVHLPKFLAVGVRATDEISRGTRSTEFFLPAQGHNHSSANSSRLSLLPAIVEHLLSL
ncbi:MAG TPA: hypothetical protein VNB95_04260, partial [Nitrososphaera sp.]|nr:hypothetical protein [Nitrososphaera sp.]